MGDEIQLIRDNDGRIWTTSLEIAEKFEKEHKNVLAAIRDLEVPEEFNRLNFKPVDYKDFKGESRPMYLMTRDGFSFLAMGFTGKKAAFWKIKFIEAFNKMEQAITEYRESNNRMISDFMRSIDKYLGPALEKQEAFNDMIFLDVSNVKKEVYVGHENRIAFLENVIVKRKSNAKVKEKLIKVWHSYYGDRCPCCGKKCEDQDMELEHFYSRERGKEKDCWVVCRECNELFEKSGEVSRAERDADFEKFQRHLLEYNKKHEGIQLEMNFPTLMGMRKK